MSLSADFSGNGLWLADLPKPGVNILIIPLIDYHL